jgi:Protein of unknown function (DUF3788)
MAISFFADKNHPPLMEEVLATVGSHRTLWEGLDLFIRERLSARSELKFYGKSYGWMVWYRKDNRTLVALYPQQNGFTVQLVLPENLVDRALQSGLEENARQVIEKTSPLSEGRWLYIRVETEGDCQDIQKLLLIKWKPK